MAVIIEKTRKTEVIDTVDVCVIGGSATGVFAAVRAAKKGLKVAIVEKQNCFGGTAASGLVHIWHSIHDTENKFQIIGGLTEEIINRLKVRSSVICNPTSKSSAYILNTEELKIELDKLIVENNIIPYLHSYFCTAVCEDDKISHIIIENKDGRNAISARFFIDASGDGDLCNCLEVPSYRNQNEQPPTMCAKIMGTESIMKNTTDLIREHREEFGLEKDWGWHQVIPSAPDVIMHAETHVFNRDLASAADLTYSEIEGRRQIRAVMDCIKKYAKKDITLLSLPSYIGIRETRHIKSHHKMTGDELLGGTRFTDAILNGSYRVDIHHSDDFGITFKYLDGKQNTITDKSVWTRWREETEKNPTFYQVPYRSLIPKTDIKNLLFCGRMIDADPVAYSALRVMVNANQMGEAAGMAAALAVEGDIAAHDVNTGTLRNELQKAGAIML